MTISYRRIVVHGHPRADYLGHVLEHITIAEQALGKPLPPRAEVHHADENERNNSNGNLIICQDRAYHKLLHARMRVLKAGGNPNIEKICSTCQRVLPFEAFNRWKGSKSFGRQSACRECSHAHQRTYVRKTAAA